jgi:hypothetical protein
MGICLFSGEKMLIRWNSFVEILRGSVAKAEGPCDLSGKVTFLAFREAALGSAPTFNYTLAFALHPELS